VIAVDTNILVYGHRDDSPFHRVASERLRELAEGTSPWAIAWPCLYEFFSIVTHPRIYEPPTPRLLALDQIDVWVQSPSLRLLAETAGYWRDLVDFVRSGDAVGPQIHDTKIAALCRHHGVDEIWTADRNFGRHMGIRVTNPLVGSD